jgi:DNA helicase-2/ATP-dependent DNA helicase PcrA
MRPAELLRMLEQMKDENISLPLQKVIQNENGVQCYTAHGAKGNEFEYVFVIGVTKKFWENKKGNTHEYKLPDTITQTNDDVDKTYKIEVARRLFYVALTRAKKYLQVSYPIADNAGKPLENSVFIDEISEPSERINKYSVPTEELITHIGWAITPIPEIRIKLANGAWIDRVLQTFTMSVSTLTKYLHCPVSFYYECILKVPFIKNDALAFGSAIHTALEQMYKLMKKNNGTFPTQEEVLAVFKSAMYRESSSFSPVQYERRMEQGTTLLNNYYEDYIDTLVKNVEIEWMVAKYLLDGVPVTGKIDKIEFDGNNCTVVDYKTGDPDKASSTTLTAAPNDKEPNGGDYWRQMVFYKLLIEHQPNINWRVTMGMFDYVEKGRNSNDYKQIHVPMFQQDEGIVLAQLKDSYTRIMNHEFDKGCGKDTCSWCKFARNYELLRPNEQETIEIDDI